MARKEALEEAGWKYATKETVTRLRHVFEALPIFKNAEGKKSRSDYTKLRLLELAAQITSAQEDKRVANGTMYWNTYTNTLRILVGALSISEVDSLFD